MVNGEDEDGYFIKLELREHSEDGIQYLRVRLKSRIKRMLWSNYPIDLAGQSHDELRRKVGIAGGALAEHQCNEYGDVHDPAACAAAALRAYDRFAAEHGL